MRHNMFRTTPLVFALVLGALCSRSAACLWDRDTLAFEAKGLPGVVDIVVGRFDRWPAEVYETRLERVTRELGAEPNRLDLYDDAGVACDRLGRHDEAIDWMTRKRAALDAGSGDQSEHEYRYLANLGTFHAHRWFARGADRSDMVDLEMARDLIAKAIELNPDAHFGREKYQLAAIKWVIDAPTGTPDALDWALVRPTRAYPTLDPIDVHLHGVAMPVRSGEAIEGLTGLVVLGNAQSSFDVHLGLAIAAQAHGDHSVAYLAALRCNELLQAGSGSVNPSGAQLKSFTGILPQFHEVLQSNGSPEIVSYFATARAAADDRSEARRGYILAQLAAGRHPDTHAGFMDGFKEPLAPKPPGVLVFGVDSRVAFGWTFVVAVIAAPFIATAVAVILILRRARSRASRFAAAAR